MRMRTVEGLSFTAAAVLGVVSLCSAQGRKEEPKFEVRGKYYDTCACQVICSCGANVTLPSEGHCEGAILLNIEQGFVGTVKMDGLNVVVVERTPKDQKVGDAFDIRREVDLLTLYLDDKASPEQKQAMPQLLDGMFGTQPMKGFKPPQWARMNLAVEGDVAKFQIDNGTKLSFEIENVNLDKSLPGVPRSEAGKRISLTNVPPFPFIHHVTAGYSKSFHYADLGVSWDYHQRNAFFGTFAIKGTVPKVVAKP